MDIVEIGENRFFLIPYDLFKISIDLRSLERINKFEKFMDKIMEKNECYGFNYLEMDNMKW